ncbi:MAG: hypothetical protein A2W25_11000 [candidate division Zixibacteria bacterium RBG_16_53_22]|nr:MAG: hypothetical protein A2W25_11000 [candidate division Zixibacteria bacterium RBG_16_53_22]
MTLNMPEIAIQPTRQAETWVASEAARCLSCYDPPCQRACPASIPIPEFIRSVRTGNLRYAADLIREANPLAAVCGTVCPEEIFCQTKCTRAQIDSPLKIRELHSLATLFERHSANIEHEEERQRVAVIGAGPAGLSCAVKLKTAGVNSVIFESREIAGGVPRNSIPKFRLPDSAVDVDLNYVANIGIDIITDTVIKNPADLLYEFDAVYVATGLPRCRKLGIPGEDTSGVVPSLFFLDEARAGRIASLDGRKVVVIGGGNVSLDVASAAAHLGAAEVRLLYRRGPLEMKVWRSELDAASARGVAIDYLTAPKALVSDGDCLTGVKCVKTELCDETDSSGRRIPREVPDSEFVVAADIAIVAIGMTSGYLRDVTINPDLSTSIPGIFVGGDLARGEGTIVEAVADGKKAAHKILEYVAQVGK